MTPPAQSLRSTHFPLLAFEDEGPEITAAGNIGDQLVFSLLIRSGSAGTSASMFR
jgi:hypothetical protein